MFVRAMSVCVCPCHAPIDIERHLNHPKQLLVEYVMWRITLFLQLCFVASNVFVFNVDPKGATLLCGCNLVKLIFSS